MKVLRSDQIKNFSWFKESENKLLDFVVVKSKESAVGDSQLRQQSHYLFVQKQRL